MPFGEGFPKPLLYMDTETSGVFYMSGGKHAKYKLSSVSKDCRQVNLICWNRGEACRSWSDSNGGRTPHIRGLVTCPEINEYNGNISYQVTETDIEFS